MTRKNPIDLRAIGLRDSGIASFARKDDAIDFARTHGWPASAVQWAANRFWLFFVVTQVVAEERRFLRCDGSWLDLPLTNTWVTSSAT